MAIKEKLLVLGFSALTLDHVEQGLARGRLPALAALTRAGTLSPLRSPVPPLSTMAWATLSSGAMPQDHGLLTDDEPHHGGFRAAGHASWRLAPVWQRLADAGIATASLCWPGTVPGTAWAGRHVDPRFAQPSGQTRDDWPLPLDVAPAALRPALRALRVHPGELPVTMVTPLLSAGAVPNLVVAEMTRMASLQAAAELLLDHGDTDCWFIQMDWLATLTAATGAASPADLPDPAWLLLDQAVARLLAKLPPAAAVMLLSPGASSAGVLLRTGQGIAANERRTAASTLDIAGIILGHFGVADTPPDVIPDGANVKRDESVAKGVSATADLARLAAFGFAPAPAPLAWQMRRNLVEAEMALSTDPARTIVLATDIIAATGDAILPLGLMAAARVALEDYAALPALAARIAAISSGHVWEDLIRGVWHAQRGEAAATRPFLERAMATGEIDVLLRAGAAWLMLDLTQEAAHCYREVLAKAPSSPAALIGVLSTNTLNPREAEPLLRRLLVIDPTHHEARAALRQLTGSAAEA